MIKSPIVAFQKLITVHGNVIANSATTAVSSAPKLPTESATTSNQISPMIDSPTSVKNSACRRPSGTSGASVVAASLRVERSSMEGLTCVPVRLPV